MDNRNINNTAIDLSLRSVNSLKLDNVRPALVKPIPRLPWTITWYQSVWSNNYHRENSVHLSEKFRNTHVHKLGEEEDNAKISKSHSGTISPGQFEDYAHRAQGHQGSEAIIDCVTEKKNQVDPTFATAVLDVACCDGPIIFERVSNPNFALTVEHNDPNPTALGGECQTFERRQIALKTYVCIYCNQSFKSLFCYQKHKKRHLNPVSVDITATHNNNAPSRSHSEQNKTTTKDLNVQFFPCKKCGSKFPSYYFVHKHRKVCHVMN